MSNLEDNEELVEQIEAILNEGSFSSKAEQKERNVANNIDNELKQNNIDGSARKTPNNTYSDVEVKLKDSKFYIEVKMDDRKSPYIKYSCKFEKGKLQFTFDNIQNAYQQNKYGNNEDGEQNTFSDMFQIPLSKSKNVLKIQSMVGKTVELRTNELKEVIKDNIDELREAIKDNFPKIKKHNQTISLEIEKLKEQGFDKDDKEIKNLISKKIGYHSFIDGSLNETNFENKLQNIEKEINQAVFPGILNDVNDFFTVLDAEKSTSYFLYRSQLSEMLKPDRNISEKVRVETSDIIEILRAGETLSKEQYVRFDDVNQINNLVLDDKTIQQIVIGEYIDEFKHTYDKMLKIAKLYIDIFEKCNEYRKDKRNSKKGKFIQNSNKFKNIKNLAQMEYWEKVRYLYQFFFNLDTIVLGDDKDHKIYNPENFNNHGFSLCKGYIAKGKNGQSALLQEMIDIVKKYYGVIHNVKYVQCGDDIYYFNKDDDPLKIINPSNNHLIYFDDAFKEFQFDLFLKTEKSGNNPCILFGVFEKDDVESGTSFDPQVKKRGDTKNFPEMGIVNDPNVKNVKKTRKTKKKLTETEERVQEILNESQDIDAAIQEGLETEKTKANQFEVQVTESIDRFLQAQEPPYNTLSVEHYEGSDSKYWSDISITNPKNGKRFWVEAKEDKYACLGSMSWKYKDGEWTCTTLEDNNPLLPEMLKDITENSTKFLEFCKDYLGTDDITLPRDLTDELVFAWKDSGSIEDTENDVLFISNKIPMDEFGAKIAKFYKFSKNEPAYYIQVGDELYLIDETTNVLGLTTKDGKPLKTLAEAYRIGRIQFRLKSYDRPQRRYWNIYTDVKILADKDNLDEDYSCSFLDQEKWPVITTGDSKGPLKPQEVIADKTPEMQAGNTEDISEIEEQYNNICKEDVVQDIVNDMKRDKSTNSENPDKVIAHSSGSLMITDVLDGRLILVNADGEQLRRDTDNRPLYFDDPQDAIEWAKERGYEVDPYEHKNFTDIDEKLDLPNVKNMKLLTNIPEDTIKNILDNQKIENTRFERSQFIKYSGLDNINWTALMDKDECFAIAALNNDQPFNGYTYIDEIQTLKKGYGKYLLEEIFKKYGKVWLMANTAAGEDLINYYRKLGLEEIVIEDSVWECPAHFFCTKECDEEKLETYCIAFYSNDNGEDQIDERKFDYRLKDKEDTYKPEKNRYAFSNKTDTYGGDDYLGTGDLMMRINPNLHTKFGPDNWFHCPECLDSKKSMIYVELDDGNDSMYGIEKIVPSKTMRGIIYVVPSKGQGMRTEEATHEITDASEFLGSLKNYRLVMMNDRDESAYVCNGARANGDDVILEFEWGDLLDYSEELKEDEPIGAKEFDNGEVRLGLLVNQGGRDNMFLDKILGGDKKVETRKVSQWKKMEKILRGKDNKDPIGQKVALMSDGSTIVAYATITDLIFYKNGEDFASQYDGENAHFVNNTTEKYRWRDDKPKMGIKLGDMEILPTPKKVEYANRYDNQYERLNGFLSDKGKLNEAEKDIGGEKSEIANQVDGVKIWIDDIREAPDGFKWFHTVREFMKYVDEHGTDNIALIDTDHDAGDYQRFGGDYIRCFDYLDYLGAKNITIHIHSANPVGANNIRRIISKNKEQNGWREVRNTQQSQKKTDSQGEKK